MDKRIVRETMLSLEAHELESATEKYFDYVADARLDRSEPIENDEQAQAEIASDLSEALDIEAPGRSAIQRAEAGKGQAKQQAEEAIAATSGWPAAANHFAGKPPAPSNE